jgi:hypothetical protein
MDDLDDPQHESRAETMNNWGFNLANWGQIGKSIHKLVTKIGAELLKWSTYW